MRLIAAVALLLSLASICQADVSFNGTDTFGRDATVTFFGVSGGDFKVRLDNTSSEDVLAPNHILTGVFFDIDSNPLLTPFSANLAPGSFTVFGPDGGGVVGGEWAYSGSVPGSLPKYGISSSGLGIFGGPSFPGSNLGGPVAVDGVQYGLTSAGDNTAIGNAAVTGGNGLIKHGVDFTFHDLPDGFDLGNIRNVYFQYGTALDEPRIPGTPGTPSQTPEPCSMALLGIGCVPFLRKLRRRAT